jgi:hypothetical protein
MNCNLLRPISDGCNHQCELTGEKGEMIVSLVVIEFDAAKFGGIPMVGVETTQGSDWIQTTTVIFFEGC